MGVQFVHFYVLKLIFVDSSRANVVQFAADLRLFKVTRAPFCTPRSIFLNAYPPELLWVVPEMEWVLIRAGYSRSVSPSLQCQSTDG